MQLEAVIMVIRVVVVWNRGGGGRGGQYNPGLLLGTEAPDMTPNSKNCSSLSGWGMKS